MDHKDKDFLIALAYTASNSEAKNIEEFLHALEKSQEELSKYYKEHPGKAKIH